jgi:hypothetical protein
MEIDGSCAAAASWPKLQALVVASNSSFGEDADSRILQSEWCPLTSFAACNNENIRVEF